MRNKNPELWESDVSDNEGETTPKTTPSSKTRNGGPAQIQKSETRNGGHKTKANPTKNKTQFYEYNIKGHAEQSVQRYLELSGKKAS